MALAPDVAKSLADLYAKYVNSPTNLENFYKQQQELERQQIGTGATRFYDDAVVGSDSERDAGVLGQIQRSGDIRYWMPEMSQQSDFAPLSYFDYGVDVGDNFNPENVAKWGSSTAEGKARMLNPGGTLIPGADNPFGEDLWKYGGPLLTHNDLGLSKRQPADGFMDNLGLYAVLGIMGAGAFAGMGAGAATGGWGAAEGGAALAAEQGFGLAGSQGLGWGEMFKNITGYDAPWGVGEQVGGLGSGDTLNSYWGDWLAEQGGWSGVPGADASAYTGLGYSPQDIANLQAGTYTGAEQTAAQAGAQMTSPVGTNKTFLDQIMKNFGPGDLAKSGINYLLQNNTADKYAQAANDAAAKGNALDQPQRFPYQAQLSQLLTNPQQFYATNPAVQGQLDVARQQFQANTGKMGTGGTQFNDYLKNVQNIASGTYNDQANLLAMLGGFNQGPGNSGAVYGNLASQGIQQGQQAQYFLPDTVKKIFGDTKWGDLMSGTQGASSY